MSARRGLGLSALVALGVLAIGAALEVRARARLPVVEPHPLALPDPGATVALARVRAGTLLLGEVTEHDVAGVLLPGQDVLEVYEAHGLSGLRSRRDAGPLRRWPLEALLPPVSSAGPHIGAGNNFAEHQQEVGVHDTPELFPKMVAPTAWNASVPDAGRLDYEVELCAVALAPIRRGQEGPFGFVLCNDFTDRWAMLAGFEPGAPLGTTGFADGKGKAGFLPIGPWLVIAEDSQAFAASVELRLSVDGRRRQQASQSHAIWDHAQIVEGAFERCNLDFRYHGEAVDWPACEALPAGTILLGGTPAGVAFRLWNIWAPWRYLAPGARVVAEGSGLGRLVNEVIEQRGAQQSQPPR